MKQELAVSLYDGVAPHLNKGLGFRLRFRLSPCYVIVFKSTVHCLRNQYAAEDLVFSCDGPSGLRHHIFSRHDLRIITHPPHFIVTHSKHLHTRLQSISIQADVFLNTGLSPAKAMVHRTDMCLQRDRGDVAGKQHFLHQSHPVRPETNTLDHSRVSFSPQDIVTAFN